MNENKIFIRRFNELKTSLEMHLPKGSELVFFKNGSAIVNLTNDIQRNRLIAMLQAKVAIQNFKHIQPIRKYSETTRIVELTLPNVFLRFRQKDIVFTTVIT